MKKFIILFLLLGLQACLLDPPTTFEGGQPIVVEQPSGKFTNPDSLNISYAVIAEGITRVSCSARDAVGASLLSYTADLSGVAAQWQMILHLKLKRPVCGSLEVKTVVFYKKDSISTTDRFERRYIVLDTVK